MPWAPGKRRLEQARLSWEPLTQDTGVTTDDIDRRIVDYGFQSYFASHHPRIIPEPFTPEACETYSKADIDEYTGALKAIAEEAYADPDLVKTAPIPRRPGHPHGGRPAGQHGHLRLHLAGLPEEKIVIHLPARHGQTAPAAPGWAPALPGVRKNFEGRRRVPLGLSFSIEGTVFLVFCVFAIAAVGYLIGRITVKGVNLGTAGVFVAALLFWVFLLPPAWPVSSR